MKREWLLLFLFRFSLSLSIDRSIGDCLLIDCSPAYFDRVENMAGRVPSDDSDEDFQEAQHARLKDSYRHAREDQREFTIEKKDQLRSQK
jgi:hypothetical protein